MYIKDLFNLCTCDEVIDIIEMHYKTDRKNDFRNLFMKIKHISGDNKLHGDFCIYIAACKEVSEDEFVEQNVFDENDTSLYFDVSAYASTDDIIYSIAATTYSEFIWHTIDEKTLKNFSPKTILAHCLWEITSYGFKDNI